MAGGTSDTAETKSSLQEVSSVQTPASGSGNPLVLVLSLVNLLVTLGILGILFVSFQKEKHHPSVEDIAAQASNASGEGEGEKSKGKEGEGKEQDKKKPVDYGRMITLEQFTVNLSTPGSPNSKFVRVNISLEVPTEDTESEVTSKMPQVRNTIIDLFNSKRPVDLATADGRDYVKEEIRNALNSFLVSGKVKGVYFTNFALAG